MLRPDIPYVKHTEQSFDFLPILCYTLIVPKGTERRKRYEKILAVILTVILLFGCASAFAASDPDFEILTVSTVQEAKTCCEAFSDNYRDNEMLICAFGGALIKNELIDNFQIWLIGFDSKLLNKYDAVYGWLEEAGYFVMATDDVTFLFPNCLTKKTTKPTLFL